MRGPSQKGPTGRAGREVTCEDIDYVVETKSLLVRLGQALLSNRDLTPDAAMSGRFTSFGPDFVRVGPEDIEGWYRVGGRPEVIFDPF